MKLRFPTLALSLGVMLSACDGSSVAPEPQAPAGGLDAVTYAFARAMEDGQVRLAVRDAMRASRVSEHKLVLQEYVRTQSGRLLVETAARAAGKTPEALLAEIGRLPEMDFYVPVREQRLTWQGGERVAVVGSTEDDARLFPGFDARGRAVTQRGRAAMPNVDALFVLHPAETKHLRVNPQAEGPGKVIQETTDGEWSGAVVERDAAGKETRTEYADLVPGGRLPALGGSLAPASVLAPSTPSFVTTTGSGTFLTYLDLREDDGIGACELIFYSYQKSNFDNSTLASATHTAGSVECPGIHNWQTRFPPQGRRAATFTAQFGARVQIDLIEDDADMDDFAGTAFWDVADSGQNRAMVMSQVCDSGGHCVPVVGAFLTVKFY